MTKDDYKEIVFDVFRRMNSRPGHIVFMRTFRFGVMRNMNPEEQKQFVDTLNELIGDGLFNYEGAEGGMDLLRLTEAGFRILYKDSKKDYQIAELLMMEFKRLNMNVGHFLPMRNINNNFIPRLNPVEQNRFVDVANRLIENQFISYKGTDQGPIDGFELLKKGYDFIYNNMPNNLASLFA